MIMTHAEIAKLLGAYMDGELSPRQRRVIANHLRQCPDCMRQIAEMRRVSSRLQAWPAVPRDMERESSFCEQIMQRLPARRAPVTHVKENRSPLSFLFPAGVVLTGAFVQSAALITAILSIVVASGLLGGMFLQIDEGLAGLMQTRDATMTQFTWVGQIVARMLERAGISGAQISQWSAIALGIVLPAIVFLAFTILIFLALSGWAGWQAARRRV